MRRPIRQAIMNGRSARSRLDEFREKAGARYVRPPDKTIAGGFGRTIHRRARLSIVAGST